MLWLALHLLYLPVEWRQPRDAGTVAVTDRLRAHRRIIASNEAARDAGIAVGMLATTALLKDPELRLIERSKADERRALQALADWALQFSGVVHLDVPRWLIWIEIGASLTYFDGLPALRTHIERGLAALHYHAGVGIAPTLEAAALFARHPEVPPALTREAILPLASSLPLTALAVEDRVVEQLQATGLNTLGDVFAIPSAALARRFGPQTTGYLQRLLGHGPDPRRRHVAPTTYRRGYEFAEPIQSLEGLLFPLRRLMQEFEGYLRGRDVAIQRLEVTLRYRDSPDSTLTLHTSAPIREAVRLFALLRERLERSAWPSAVTQVIVSAGEFQAPEVLQGDLFDDAQRHRAGWSALLDQLRARLGEHAIKQLGLRDDHRPERAWCVQSESAGEPCEESFPDRPLWLIEPIPVSRPAKVLGRPERIESGWWSGVDTTRDYYRAISDEGARWWLYREIGSTQWYLHGLWA